MEQTLLPPFDVTRSAIDQIEQLGGTVRVDVAAGGCCGSTYLFSTDRAADSDQNFGCPGAWLAVSIDALAVLRGAQLDYSARVKPARFRVLRNPNTMQRCPCNRSFGRDWPGRGQPDCRAACRMPWDE